MYDLKRISVASLQPDPDQPRKHFDETELLALGQSIKQHGQQMPLIVYDNIILDGERRWRAAKLTDIPNLEALCLEARPTPAQLRIYQMINGIHRKDISAMEQSDFMARMMQENNWSIGELAEKLNRKQPYISKLLAFQKGCDELRTALHAGLIDQDKAYTICQESDHNKQRVLLNRAGDLTREQLRQKARSNGESVELKAAVARFPLPTGVLVTVQGRKMTLATAIDAMLEAVKELKKGQTERWDITTAMRVMRDRARGQTV